MASAFQSCLEMTTALVFGDHVIVIKDSPIQTQAMVTDKTARMRLGMMGKAQGRVTWLVKGRFLNVLTLSPGHL